MFENTPLVELTVGRSSVRQRILALLLDESNGRLHLREIQRRADTSPGTASRELGKLVAAGLVEREAEGNQVYFRATASPFATVMRSLLIAMPAPEVGRRPARLHGPKSARASAAAGSGGGTSNDLAPTLPSGIDTEIAPSVDDGRPFEAPPAGSSADPQASAAYQSPDTLGVSAVGDVAAEDSTGDTAPRVLWPQLRNETALSPASVAQTPDPSGRGVMGGTMTDPLGLSIARRLAESIRPLYGDALRGIYLYGDRASGPAPADAGIEVIVVLDRVDQYGTELERTSHICAALSRELNLVVSRVFATEADWNGGPDGRLPSVRREAIAL